MGNAGDVGRGEILDPLTAIRSLMLQRQRR
jgi:hypothetical protein